MLAHGTQHLPAGAAGRAAVRRAVAGGTLVQHGHRQLGVRVDARLHLLGIGLRVRVRAKG
eukprot:scaffold133920_cov84-Phaeocystis_antarctica.AAC.1